MKSAFISIVTVSLVLAGTISSSSAEIVVNTTSDLCIHPSDGSANPAENTNLVLHPIGCRRGIDRIQFRFLSSGSIQHVSSGKCVHPSGGNANMPDNTELVLHSGCDETRLSFRLTESGSIQHVSSGKCVHPIGGTAGVNGKLVLHYGCNEPRVAFAFQQISAVLGANHTLPDVDAQNNDWSCGPNSAARVLRFHNFNASYDEVQKLVSVFNKVPGSNKFGTTPSELQKVMRLWAGNRVKLEREANFENLLDLLSQGKPVITLVRVGSIQTYISGTWPQMHWWVVDGFDERTRTIYYTDTDSRRYEMSYDEFLGKWGWSIGRGLASSTMKENGLKTRTIAWID